MSNRLLTLLILLLVTAIGATIIFVVTNTRSSDTSTTVSNSVEAVEEGRALPAEPVQSAAYQDAEAVLKAERSKPASERNLGEVVALYQSVAGEAISPAEQQRAFLIAAMLQSEYDPIGGIRALHKIVETEEGTAPSFRAAAIESMVMVYQNNPRNDIFTEIFSGTLTELQKDGVGSTSPVDASIRALLEHGEDIWPLATIELRLASARIDDNLQTSIPRKLVNYCRQLGSVVDDVCSPDVAALLTREELRAYDETKIYVLDRLREADVDIERLRIQGGGGILVRALGQRAAVQSKGLLYGIGTPGDVERSFQEAIEAAQGEGDIDVEARAVINYAVFLRLWWWDDTNAVIAKIQEILAPFYTGSRYHNSDFITQLQAAYQAELEAHTNASASVIQGPLMLTTTDENFKAYLQNDLGWDFEHPAIKAFFKE